MSELTVRSARPGDASSLVKAASDMAAESDYRNDAIVQSKLLRIMQEAVDPAVSYVTAFVADYRSKTVGGAVVALSEAVFSTALVVSDLGVYVHPTFRGRAITGHLLHAVEAWATEQGAVRIHLGITTNVNPEHTRRAYEAAGYECVGYNFRKKL